MLKSQILKNYPIVLCLLLMFFHFMGGYPGGMSPDTWDQYAQSINKNYNSHHPPLMAMVWSLFHFIYQGPQTMLLLNLAFLWGGVLLLFSSDPTNKYRYLYFLIPFLPNILSQSTVIWKDVAFTFSSFFVVASCIFYLSKQKTPSIMIVIGLLLIVFYAEGVKFQARFITPILVLWILSLYLQTNLCIRIICTTVISTVIIYGNMLLIQHFSIDTHSEQLRQLFDIAAVSNAIKNDDLMPDYVKDNKNLYSFDKLQQYYTPKSVNALIFDDSRIYERTNDPVKLQQMHLAYLQAITNHPIAYLKHRAWNFARIMITSYYSGDFGIKDKEIAEKYGISVEEHQLKNIILKYFKIFPKVLTKNYISLILLFVYLITILRYRKQQQVSITILSYIVAICFVFTVILFFTTMAHDYRYYYLVRVLTLFSIPIYLQLRQEVKSS